MAIKERAETEIILSGGEKAGKSLNELTAQSVKLYRQIKKMEEGSEEFVKATAEYQKVNGRLKDVRNQVNGVTKAQNTLNSSLGQYIPFNSQLQKFMGSYKGIAEATKGQTMAQRALNLVTKAFPLALLIGLFASFISYLSTTQEGMDKLRKITLPVIQVFERLKGLLQTFGQGLFQILTGDIVGGFKTLKESVLSIGDAFTEGIAAGKELSQLTEEIEKKENDLILTRQRLNREYEEFKAISKDTRKSEAERQAAANSAIGVLEKQKNAELELLNLQIRKRELEASANDTSRADQAEINQLLAQRETLEANFARQKATLTGVLAKTEKSVTGDLKNEIAEREKAELDYAKKVEKASQDLANLRISLIQDGTERSIAEINARFEREIAAFEGTENQKTEFLKLKQQERDQAIDAIITDTNQKAFEKNLLRMEEEKMFLDEMLEQEFFEKMITEEERNEQLYEIEKNFLERKLALLVASGNDQSLEYQKIYTDLKALHFNYEADKTEKSQQEVKARMDLEKQAFQQVSSIFGQMADLLANDEASKKKNWKAIKALKKAEILSNLPLEISNIWMASAKLGPILGPILGTLQTGLAIGRSGINITQLNAVKFAKGGPVFGPSHAEGGIPFTVKGSSSINEMEGNEIILTKGVYEDPILRAAASQINTLGGGRSFAMGGPINPLQPPISANETPAIIQNITNNPAQESNRELINEMKALREDINSYNREVEVKISLQKLNKENARLRQVEIDASS